ncbi:MAG: Hsp70 family protein [Betaproteobacteria bacterium]
MAGWALDLGTTNSAIARWDEAAGQPQLVELLDVCRSLERDDPLEAPRMVPSAVHLLEDPGLLDRIGGWQPLSRHLFLGRRALIGRPALERNRETVHPAFVPTFKAALSDEATRPLARRGRHKASAREVAEAFLRELLASTKQATGHRIRDLVVTSPVSAFETYRAELQRILQRLGVRRVRFVDEPVAAALGYGLSLSQERTVLVVDIGGGTMHVVLVALSPRGSLSGEARVISKQGRPLGGNAVDGWVLEEACSQAGLPSLEPDGDEQTRFWRRLMLAEACRVKEAVHFDETAVFRVTPPGFGARGSRGGGSALLTFTRAQLAELLERNGFYRGLEACLAAMFEDGRARVDDVDDVLLVGGSTLLPGVFARLEQRFERRRMRAWQPFEAVVYGGACFAADRVAALDFIVHDYAFVTHDAQTGVEQHTVVVPHGTRFPTPPDFWKRQLVPTCSLGEPESIFRLVICEVARGDGSERRFVYDAAGDLHKVGGAAGQEELVVPLNATSPTLGYLDPPHDPRDRRPRLEIAFGVNAERWLVATVLDLLTRKELMREEPVVRLV